MAISEPPGGISPVVTAASRGNLVPQFLPNVIGAASLGTVLSLGKSEMAPFDRGEMETSEPGIVLPPSSPALVGAAPPGTIFATMPTRYYRRGVTRHRFATIVTLQFRRDVARHRVVVIVGITFSLEIPTNIRRRE